MGYGYKSYASNALNSSLNITQADAERYQNLLASLEEDDDDYVEESVERHRDMLAQRKLEVTILAEEYGNFLGTDLTTESGRSWLERTVSFYSGSESLYERFKTVVQGTRRISQNALEAKVA